jgi:protein TonB
MASILPAGAAESVFRRQAMFEDATFESMGIITTRSRRWMVAVTSVEALILLTAVLIPLFYPQALPHAFANLMQMTAPQPEPQTPPRPIIRTTAVATDMPNGVILAPTQIPTITFIPAVPEPVVDTSVGNWAFNTAPSASDLFHNPQSRPTVRPALSGPVRISSLTAESEIILKTLPVYPPIARAARIEGTVRLAATISKNGTIENLRVTSGHPMLQQAALNAVSCWRYKPYLLDGQPVEVETTVEVIFTLSR